MAILKIDGKEIEVETNTLLLEAAKEAGVKVPTFCYQADLSRLGACRICLVEIEGQPKLQPACVTPVMQDMSVFTESEKVTKARAGVLEFFLSNHAMDCPVCDKGGECELQDMVYKHGPSTGMHAEKKIRFHDEDYPLSPVIVKNSNRCVKCLRCVRVCKEAVGVGVLGSLGRGAHQEETSFLRNYLDCDHCGNCIEVCPVGCYMRRPYRYKARPWDLRSATTICPYCATGCQTKVQARGNEIVRSIAKLGKGVNHEMLCARGRFGLDYASNPNRLTVPLKKNEAGEFEEIGWDEAIRLIKDNARKTTGDRIGGIASARLSNEELFIFQKMMRTYFKTHNVDSSPRWSAEAEAAFIEATGMNEGGVSLWDSAAADTVLIIGTQISDENPVTDYILRRSFDTRRVRAVIASPMAMKLDKSVELTLRHAPNAEGKLLTAAAAMIFNANPTEFANFGWAEELRKTPCKEFLKKAGVEEADVEALVSRFKASDNITIMAGTQFLRHPESIRGLHILRSMLKALGKGITILPVLDRSNQRGAWEMGVHPYFGPGFAAAEKRGMDCDAMLEAAAGRQIDMLYIAREDVVSMFPDADFAKEALSKLKFLVVQDIFLNQTAELADLVLPGASFVAKDGTYTNQEGRVQAANALGSPLAGTKTDLAVFNAICKDFDFEFKEEDYGEVLAHIRAENPMYRNVRCTEEASDDSLVGPGFDFESDLLKAEPAKEKPEPQLSEDLPFTLLTGNHLYYSGTLSRRSGVLKGLQPEPIIEMDEKDAAKIGLSDGERVNVIGRHHREIYNLKTRKGGYPGLVFIPENYSDKPVNKFLKRGEGLEKVTVKKA